jgi:serine/threonine protein phosphatase 1
VSADANLADLGRPRRIWAVAACRGTVARLTRIHEAIAERFTPGDRLVYLGDYLGHVDSALIVDQLLAFRTYLLAAPGMIPSDFIYLRGVQEEIWSKLLQIQFATNPGEVLRWMLERGASETITAYGGSPHEGLLSARDGAVSITKWTNSLRNMMRHHPGHDKLMSVLQRAALTELDGKGQLLFVHAGLDPARPLSAQGDSFWWASTGFARLEQPFETFKRVFRGADPTGEGPVLDGYSVTLDARKRDGAPLLAVAVSPAGDILHVLES